MDKDQARPQSEIQEQKETEKDAMTEKLLD
jgi:hypothetical protein